MTCASIWKILAETKLYFPIILPKQYYNNGKDAKPLNEDENGWDTRSLKHINNQYLGGNDAQTEKSMGFMDSNSFDMLNDIGMWSFL